MTKSFIPTQKDIDRLCNCGTCLDSSYTRAIYQFAKDNKLPVKERELTKYQSDDIFRAIPVWK